MSLRAKTTLCLFVIIVLLVTLVQLYFGNAIRSVLIRRANEYQNSNFAHVKNGVEQIVAEVGIAANTLSFNEKIVTMVNGLQNADSWSRYEYNTYIWQEMRSVRNVMLPQYIVDIFIAAPGGTASYMDYDSMDVLGYQEIQNAKWYREWNGDAANNLWLTPTSAFFITRSSGLFLTYVQRLWGEQIYGASRGLLFINIEVASSFQKTLDDLIVGEGTALYLFDGKGRLICSTEDIEVGMPLSGFEFSEYMHTSEEAGTSQSFQYESSLGLAYGNNTRIRNTNWVLVQTMPYDLLMNETDQIQLRFIYIVMLMGAAVLLFAMLATTPTLQALSKVVIRTQAIARGDFTGKLELGRKDEIGKLAAAVDDMAADIAKLLEQLRKENELRNQLNLEMLKGQLDPHFLFNALNSIKCIASLNENDVICRMITDLSFLLESALGKNEEFTTLREELEFTAHYVALQQIRFNDFRYALDVEEDILDCIVPRLILQPLIENCIKHGFLNNPLNGEILLCARREKGFLILEISDNGVGIEPGKIRDIMDGEALREARTIGLYNILSRLRIYYGGAYTPSAPPMEVCPREQSGVKVIIRIPLNREELIKPDD